MKLAVLGGGGVRSPFLAKSIIAGADKIGLKKVVFMDINETKLRTFGVIAKNIAKMLNPAIEFELTSDAVAAVKDADFVITTLRVGEDEGRVKDERVALDLGILGQETTGAGGFAMALRSIPALKGYCELVKKHSKKGAFIFNFTNPSGLVTQALRSEGYDNVYGICDAPSGFKMQLEELYNVKPSELSMTCFGLNHLSWFKDIKVKGKDVSQELANDPKLYKNTEMHIFDKDIVRLSGNMLLNEYLYFYYYREQAVSSILAAGKTRGETILEINKHMMNELDKIDVEKESEKAFDIFISHYLQRENSYMSIESNHGRAYVKKAPSMREFLDTPDAGGYAGVALSFIKAYHTGEKVEMVLSIPNAGAIDGLEDDDVVEISCIIDKNGANPVKIGKVPDMQMNLIRAVKFYERNAFLAIKDKSMDKAIVALTAHPLVNSYSLAKKLVDGYLKVHKEYTGAWKQ